MSSAIFYTLDNIDTRTFAVCVTCLCHFSIFFNVYMCSRINTYSATCPLNSNPFAYTSADGTMPAFSAPMNSIFNFFNSGSVSLISSGTLFSCMAAATSANLSLDLRSYRYVLLSSSVPSMDSLPHPSNHSSILVCDISSSLVILNFCNSFAPALSP